VPFPIGLLFLLRAWPASPADAARIEVSLQDRIVRQDVPIQCLAAWNEQLLDPRAWDRVWAHPGWTIEQVTEDVTPSPNGAAPRPGFARAADYLEAHRALVGKSVAYPQMLTYDSAIDALRQACASVAAPAGTVAAAVSGPDGHP
jgi:hypothetical protein